MKVIDGTITKCIHCGSKNLLAQHFGTVCAKCGELQEKKKEVKLNKIIIE